EEVEVCGEVGLAKACAPVQFTGDPATAQVVSVSYNIEGWAANKNAVVTINAKVEDAHANPVANVEVHHSTLANGGQSQTLEIADESPITSEEGTAPLLVINKDPDAADITNHQFTLTNAMGVESVVNQEIIWGMWNWSTPLEVKWVPNVKTGATCPAGWRFLTDEEETEHDIATVIRKLGAAADPITAAWLETGQNVVAGINSNPSIVTISWWTARGTTAYNAFANSNGTLTFSTYLNANGETGYRITGGQIPASRYDVQSNTSYSYGDSSVRHASANNLVCVR
ncbi:hypothetical protein ACPV47_24895, partial [Vibrio jasicida]